MTKKQLIAIVSTKAHLTNRAAREAVETFLGEITKSLERGEKVVLSGFGTFRISKVGSKEVLVPGTGERRMIKSHRAPRFSPGKPLRIAVR